MPVLHVEKKGNFTQVTNAILRDPKMSLKAKGLLTLMLSMDGDRWTWSVAGLASLSRDGVDSVREGLKELHRLGYFFSRRKRLAGGKLGPSEYWVFEAPQQVSPLEERGPAPEPEAADLPASAPEREKPVLENPEEEKPVLEDPPLRNINLKNIITKIKMKKENGSVSALFPSDLIRNRPEPEREEEMGGTQTAPDGSFLSSPVSNPPAMDFETAKKRIQEKVDYEGLRLNYDVSRLDAVIGVMAELLSCPAEYISISGKQCSREYIQEQLEAFNPMVMEYLLGSMDKVSGPVRNVKKYMTACILNAPNTWQYDADVRARHVLYDLPL